MSWANSPGSDVNLDESVPIARRDFVKFILTSYLVQFNEFDTGFFIVGNQISIRVYYRADKEKERADQILVRVCDQISSVIKSQYPWAKELVVQGETTLETKESYIHPRALRELPSAVLRFKRGVRISEYIP